MQPFFFWNLLEEHSSVIIPLLYYLMVFLMSVTLIRQNRAPIKTIAWLMVIVLIPIAGIIAYIFFGRYLKKERLFDDKKAIDAKLIKKMDPLFVPDLKKIEGIELSDTLHSKLNIIKLLINNSKSRFTSNNSVTILQNGYSTYKEIFEQLTEAKKFIHFEYYIIEEGDIADRLKKLFITKAREGVKVRVIYDYVGSLSLSNKYVDDLKNEGVEIYPFLPVRFGKLTSKINYRNHRKIIVIDGVTGFMGGINIADKYIYGNELGQWRDTHMRIDGEAVDSLNLIFITDWYYLSDEILSDEKLYFPEHKKSGNDMLQIISSGPDSESAYIMDAYFAAIATAKKNIYISTPYLLPTQSILQALKTASLSGVEVNIVIPFKADSPIVSLSSKSYISELLDANINVHLYKNGFTHAKVLIVDEVLSSIGTANVDFRSFEQNLEVNAMIYSNRIAKELMIEFNKDIDNSKKLTQRNWRRRRKIIKVLESFSRIFAPLL